MNIETRENFGGQFRFETHSVCAAEQAAQRASIVGLTPTGGVTPLRGLH